MKSLSIITALVILCGILGAQQCSQTRKAAQLTEAFSTAHDTATYYRTKYGEAAARNKTLELTQAQLLRIPAENDRLLKALQQATDKNSQAAAAFTVSREGAAVGKTTQIIYRTTPGKTDTVRAAMPIYKGVAKADGFSAEVVATADTMAITRYQVEQDLTVNFTTAKGGLFRRGKQTVEVVAKSPGGKVLDIRAFSVPEQPPRRGIWFIAGYAAGLLTPRPVK